jgi:hypothetical protein
MSVKLSNKSRLLAPGNLTIFGPTATGPVYNTYQTWPSSHTYPMASYTGDFVAGIDWSVTQGGYWLYGYQFYVASGMQTQTGYKFATWQMTGPDAGTIVPNTTVSVPGSLPIGWYTAYLATPLLLTLGVQNSNAAGTTIGAAYHSCYGYVSTTGFPQYKNIFGIDDQYSAGITNGPLNTFSSESGSNPVGGTSKWFYQMPYSPTISDPTAGMPTLNDEDDDLGIGVIISNQPPASPHYRMCPNSPVFNTGAGAQVDAYTLGLPFVLSESPPTGINIWHFSPSGVTILPTWAGIWNYNTQAIVAQNTTPTWSGAAGSGWVSTPITGVTGLTPGTKYVGSDFTANNTSGWFTVETDWFGSGNSFPNGIQQGIINFPGPSLYNLGTTLTYPGTTNNEYDGIDVEVY